MKKFLIHWLVNTAALLLVAAIVPGVEIIRWQTAILAALVLGLLNTFLRPVLILVTLPISILTLGIFAFFVNVFMFYLAAQLVEGFVLAGFWSAFWGALLFSVISFVLSVLISPGGKLHFQVHHHPRRPPRYPDAIDVDAYPTKEDGNDRGRLQKR